MKDPLFRIIPQNEPPHNTSAFLSQNICLPTASDASPASSFLHLGSVVLDFYLNETKVSGKYKELV